jgi:RNA polymerase sigma-70 factor (ECF subfamily)
VHFYQLFGSLIVVMREYEDNELIRKCLQGETNAFEPLIDKYQKVLFNTVLRMIGDYDDAQDVTQSVFIKAFENLASFNPRFKFFSWIYKMAMNESINLLNRRKRQSVLPETNISTDRAPDTLLELAELEKVVQEAIEDLSIDHRMVLVLRHFADLSYSELSFVLEIPEKTVKSRLFSARQRLADILKERGITKNGN